MSFEIKDKDLAGRIGILKTRHGAIETPAFFPVINPIKQEQEVPIRDIVGVGFKQLITNAYIIRKNFHDEAISKGVHKLLEFEGPIMTDSGAYQILQYGAVDVRNREIVEFQKRIGSDIAVILDIPTSDDASYDDARKSVEETLRRAREVLDIVTSSTDTLWVLPIQGGVHLDLVKYSATKAREIEGYEIYAIGSPVRVMEHYRFWILTDMIYVAKTALPIDKPVHLFGAGHPMILPFAVALGIDMFDSASYIIYARDLRYMTDTGTLRLEEIEEFPCECPICSKYTPKDVLEMPRPEQVRLLALHNLYVIKREIHRIKIAISEGRLWELLEIRARSHPLLYRAFKNFKKYVEFLEKLDPRTKGEARGIFIYDSMSLYRPKVLRFRNKCRMLMRAPSWALGRERLILIPADPDNKPFSQSPIYAKTLAKLGLDITRDAIVFYIPILGLIPLELEDMYPASQFEICSEFEYEALLDLAKQILELIDNMRGNVKEIFFILSRDLTLSWSLDVLSILTECAKRMGKDIRELVKYIEI